MSIFNLPDLGEGLPDAEIVEWHVQEGEQVKTDQILVSMETAKAVVDVPSPQNGIVLKCFGKAGDIINTGSALVEFASDKSTSETVSQNDASKTRPQDLPKNNITQDVSAHSNVSEKRVKAMPSVRALAKRLDVDLTTIKPSGNKNRVTAADVEKAANHPAVNVAPADNETVQALRGVRRAMANAMTKSHSEVVTVTLVDDADIQAWLTGSDITWRVVRAIVFACKQEPALNAHFDMKNLNRTLFGEINLGIAMDTEEGLFVPVIRDVQSMEQAEFRNQLEAIKSDVKNRQVAPEILTGSTIQLSNFGTFAGRYANPVIVPPNVSIIGTGKIREEVVARNQAIAIHKVMPISLSIDHRAVTGGEAARFLRALIDDLEKSH